MDWELAKKWITRKGAVTGVAIAAIAGAFAPVGGTAITCITIVSSVFVVVQGLIDWQKEKNNE